MSFRKSRSLVLPFAAFAFALAACGGTTIADTDDGTDHNVESDAGHDESEHGAEEFTFGSPADASEADRVIEVDAGDDFTFSPAEITVSAGETITFVVTNTGNIPHDFTLGDQSTQDEHEAKMAEMMTGGEMPHDDANAVLLEPGMTEELTWHFSKAGTFVIGCHQPGHYAAGMVGAVNVEA